MRVLIIALLLAGCQQHVVEAHRACEKKLGTKCVVIAVPVTHVNACVTAMRAQGGIP